MAVRMGRAEGVVALLAKDKWQDREKPEEAAEEGDLKAVETLAQQFDQRSHYREQHAPDRYQKGGANRHRQRPQRLRANFIVGRAQPLGAYHRARGERAAPSDG